MFPTMNKGNQNPGKPMVSPQMMAFKLSKRMRMF